MKRRDSSRILVVGASGYFGSLVVEDVLRHTDYDVWVGSRGGRTHDLRRVGPPCAGNVTPCRCDLTEPVSVDAVVPQVDVAICAAGPYQAFR